MLESFADYSEKLLERYFIQKLSESYEFRDIGAWWETRKEHCDIDVVAIYLEKKKALAIEVKRQASNFQPETLRTRIEHLKAKALNGYTIEERCLTIEDM